MIASFDGDDTFTTIEVSVGGSIPLAAAAGLAACGGGDFALTLAEEVDGDNKLALLLLLLPVLFLVATLTFPFVMLTLFV
jgi:hypothetical protein